MGLGISEIVIIIIAIAILLFGGKKITEMARSMGSASGEFKKAKRQVERELADEASDAAPVVTRAEPDTGKQTPTDTAHTREVTK